MDVVNHDDHVDPVNQVEQLQTIRLIACPCLAFEHGKIDRYVPEGLTVAGHLRAIGWTPEGLNARVSIDGAFIEQARWEYAVPRAGQVFVTRVIPLGSQGGGKDALRIVAMLGVITASVFAPALIGAYGGMAGALFITTPGMASLTMAGISVLGTLAMTALIPTPLPRRALPLPFPQRALKEAA